MKLLSTPVTHARFERDLKPWILPTLATAAFPLLLLHTSDLPVVFNRYSIGYTTVLVLLAINLRLLWRKPLLRVSPTAFLLYIVAVASLSFFFDFFVIGLRAHFFLDNEVEWVNFILIITCLVQADAPQFLIKRFSAIWNPFFRLKDVALVGGSIVFAVVVAELVFRFFILERFTPRNDRDFVRLMSSQWQEPIAVAKPEGTFRILGLADSFGVVGGKSGNYHYLIENILRGHSPLRMQMINASAAGYAPRHELAILRLALAYSPDVVLHGFFVGNDFTLQREDLYRYGAIRIDDEPGTNRYRPSQFFLVDAVRNGLLLLRDQRQIRLEERTGVVKEVGYLSKKFFIDMQWRKMNLYKPSSRGDMKQVMPILDAIRHTAEKKGGRYVMITHPDQTQVDERLKGEITTKYNASDNRYDFDFPQKVLASYCAATGTLCVDLLPLFRAKARLGDVLYTIRDGHYSLKGNQLAAATISQFLNDQKLIRGH